eukprot:m.592181 g.592181  ORF g.592181 m.592181 type:complete len:231 (-) comp22389_c0_seq25:2922-3614(-)
MVPVFMDMLVFTIFLCLPQFLSYESLLFPNVRTSDGRSVVSRVKRLGDKVSEFAESTLVHRFRRTGRAPKTMMFVRRGRHARTTASDQDNPFYKYLHTPAAEGDNTTSDIREVKVAADNPGVQHTVMAHVAGPQPSPSANLHVLFPRLLLGLAAESTVRGRLRYVAASFPYCSVVARAHRCTDAPHRFRHRSVPTLQLYRDRADQRQAPSEPRDAKVSTSCHRTTMLLSI